MNFVFFHWLHNIQIWIYDSDLRDLWFFLLTLDRLWYKLTNLRFFRDVTFVYKLRVCDVLS